LFAGETVKCSFYVCHFFSCSPLFSCIHIFKEQQWDMRQAVSWPISVRYSSPSRWYHCRGCWVSSSRLVDNRLRHQTPLAGWGESLLKATLVLRKATLREIEVFSYLTVLYQLFCGWSVHPNECENRSSYIYMYIYIYIHTHIYIYIHTHTHTHIYIQGCS
jgi:hypothetical protein